VTIATLLVMPLVMLPAAAGASTPSKLPSNACKLLTLAQVRKVLPDAGEGEPIHDKADKEEICNWEVDGSSDYLGLTTKTFTGDSTTAKALYGTTESDRKVKGLGPAAAFADNASDYTVRAVLGKVVLIVKLQREADDTSTSSGVAQLKSDATAIAKQAASKL
jgi:hypothetical protein